MRALRLLATASRRLRLVRAHHQRDLLRLTDVIDLGGKIQSPQRHAEQEPQPGHDAVAIADAHAGLGQVQLEAADVLGCGRVRRPLRETQRTACSCGCGLSACRAQSLRAFMSSIMRWRSGLTVSVLMGNSCLG